MQDFLSYIYQFVRTLFYTIRQTFVAGNNNAEALNIGMSYQAYDEFLDKQIISGDLINIGMTWKELFFYFSIILIAILFIIFIFNLVRGVIKFFFIGK